jgi:hypothetical protein
VCGCLVGCVVGVYGVWDEEDSGEALSVHKRS